MSFTRQVGTAKNPWLDPSLLRRQFGLDYGYLAGDARNISSRELELYRRAPLALD
jgi:hypothetical protein